LALRNPMPYREVTRKLRRAGFAEVSQRGSHVKFARYSEEGTRTTIVPRRREVPIGTLRSILRQAGLSVGEFERL